MDFWARGAFHRAKKIARGPRRKGKISGVGFDGVRRKPRKRSKTGQFVSEPALIPYDDAPVAEAPEPIRAPVRSRRCGMSTQ